MIKLAVALPAFGGNLDVGHAGTWLSFGHALAANDSKFELVAFGDYDCNPVADARNMAVSAAAVAGADWLLMVDADVSHHGPADDIPSGGYDLLEMVASGERLSGLTGGQVAAIGAAVTSRRDFKRMAWVEKDGVYEHLWGGLGKVTEVARLSTSCLAICVRWLKAAWPRAPWFRHEASLDPLRCYGEDIRFCDDARARGGRIYCDGNFRPQHVMRAERR
jgi:hypothetical protein